MSRQSKRIQTLKAIVAGSIVVRSNNFGRIMSEFNEVENVGKVHHKPRRLLLQVLHSTRALDSTLKAFVITRGVAGSSASIGAALRALQTHTRPNIGRITQAENRRYSNSITRPRNRYMHEAGAYPGKDNEILRLLSEMQACLARIVTL